MGLNIPKGITLLLALSVFIVSTHRLYGEDKTLSPNISIEASVNESLITIGQKIKYTIKVISPKKFKLSFPSNLKDFGGFRMRDFYTAEPKAISNEFIEYERSYTLDTLTVGSYIIPSYAIEVYDGDKPVSTLNTQEIFVTVKSLVEGDLSGDIRDIKPTFNLPNSLLPIFFIAAILLLVFCALFFGAKMFINARKNKALPPKLAHEIALEALDHIESLGLIEKKEYKEFYYLISNTLRKYIENRYHLNAPEQTTEEFIENIQYTNFLNKEQIDGLCDYLESCDLVKYAKLTPQESDVMVLMQRTRDFIVKTKGINDKDAA